MAETRDECTAFDEKIYEPLADFARHHPTFRAYQLESFLQQGLTLFTTAANLDFEKVEEVADKIIANLPYVKQVFSKPWINLKFKDEVLPAEFVKRMNSATFQDLSRHPEMISKVEIGGSPVPSKLLSKVYIDDYSIYENRVFCKLVDQILTFTRKKDYYLREILLAKERSSVDFFEKTNHPQFLLALGELHVAFIRKYNDDYQEVSKIVDLLTRIRNVVVPRLKKPVYQLNDVKNETIRLRRTNLFYHEKNYSRIYKLYDYFLKNKVNKKDETPPDHPDRYRRNYFRFSSLLTLFAILHFNYAKPEEELSTDGLSSSFSFKGYGLSLASFPEEGALVLTFQKEASYKAVLLPRTVRGGDLSSYRSRYGADEAVFLSPYERDNPSPEEIFASMNNIDSFRRIQQILLRGMIASDQKKEICPFCGYALRPERRKRAYACNICDLLIKEETCPDTGRKYWTTSLVEHVEKPVDPRFDMARDPWVYNRRVEEGLNFRNITPIDNRQRPVCPWCGKAHALRP